MTGDKAADLLYALALAVVVHPLEAVLLATAIVAVLVGSAYGLFLAAEAGCRALQDPPSWDERELDRVETETDAAIRDIREMRRHATRRMFEVNRGRDVIEGTAIEIEGRDER
jgi:hypothetical protein